MLKAVFIDGIDEITVNGLTQWDTGQKLEITLDDLPTNFQVHFAQYKRSEIAYVVEATSNGGVAIVKIPNKILQVASKSACAWIYIPSDDGHETIKTINLPIQERARPADYVYKEEEILYFEKVMKITEENTRRAEQAALECDAMREIVAEDKAEVERNITTFEENNRNNYSNSLKANASGEVVRVDDVSPAQHDVKVKIHGKNQFDMSKFETMTVSEYGYLSEVGENYIVITTPESYAGNGNCGLALKLIDLCPTISPNKTYTLSGESPSTNKCIYLRDTDKYWNYGTARELTEDDVNSRIAVYGYSAVHDDGTGECKISNIQLEEGDTVTEYEPYIDPTSMKVIRCGKNLLPYGTITFVRNQNNVLPSPLPAGVYTISANITSNDTDNTKSAVIFMNGSDNVAYISLDRGKSSHTFIVEKPIEKVDFCASYNYSQSEGDTATWADIQLEKENISTDYEPYTGEEYTPNADGTVDGILSLAPTMTIFTDTEGANIDIEYNQDINVVAADINSALDAIISIQDALIGGDA